MSAADHRRSVLADRQRKLLGCFRGDLDGLLHAAFRYYLGRCTAAACDFAERLAMSWPHLGSSTREMIARELEEEFRRDDAARQRAAIPYPLGMDCDRAAWEQVRQVAKAPEVAAA